MRRLPDFPEYLEAAIDITFAGNRPDGFLGAIATAGGTGALRTAVDNYVERGDQVLTSDWFWGTYNVICQELGCSVTNFQLFDEEIILTTRPLLHLWTDSSRRRRVCSSS